MGAGHHRPLFVDRDTPLHRLAPQCKILATTLFVFAVVATDRQAFWAFGVDAVAIGTLAAVAGLSPIRLVRRLTIELPFLAFAVLLPLVGQGRRVDVLGIPMSVEGLWAAWNILAKGTLGVAACVVLVATTQIPDILRGLERLHVPRLIVAIATFMIRYGEILVGDVRVMRTARISRGHDPRWIWQARAIASSAGTLFVRSYERGERVYLGMVSRGYAGALPDLDPEPHASATQWLAALTLPAIATVAAIGVTVA